jgi:hypothetical protein
MKTLSEKRAEAGRKGGRVTVKRYGKRYMRRLGKWGAHRMHSTYKIKPLGQCEYALVHRVTGETKALLSGHVWKKHAAEKKGDLPWTIGLDS